MPIKFERTLVTPELAENFLKKNINNRSMKWTVVRKYAGDMKNGRWDENGNDPIVINKYDELENGQHRLRAVIESGRPVRMAVLTGTDPAKGSYDRGRLRTVVDTLAIRGNINKQYLKAPIMAVPTFVLKYIMNEPPTDVLIEEFMERYAEQAAQATTVIRKGASSPLCNFQAARVAAFCAILCGVPYEELEDFFHFVNTGLPRDGKTIKCSAPNTLRNMYIKAAGLKTLTQSARNVDVEGVTELAIKDYVDGKDRRVAYKYEISKLPYRNRVRDIIKADMKIESAEGTK